MADDNHVPFYVPNRRPAAPGTPKPGKLLFEFVRPSDRTIVRCELRFHGESAGGEVQFFE